jgi:hypothetical protein
MKPLCIDLYCGLGGWAEGFLAEGYDVIGFDLERRPYPAQLVLQDVLTIHGSQFRNAACIVASPPCQAYSYRAMPWKRARSLPPPSNELFDACFRIQREASADAGQHIPLIVENVCGAQKWVGRARWHYGSYYLWGDVPALMPWTYHRKVPGLNFHEHEKTGRPGRSFQSAAVAATEHLKNTASWWKRSATAEDWQRDAVASTRGKRRKEASALIAKIPFDLAQHIARCFKPADQEQAA